VAALQGGIHQHGLDNKEKQEVADQGTQPNQKSIHAKAKAAMAGLH